MPLPNTPTSGFGDPQQAGGRGDPNVGTGWNNFDSYLNQSNVDTYGKNQTGPAAMDPAAGKSAEGAAFQNWMWDAAGNPTAPEPPPEPPKVENAIQPGPKMDFSGIEGWDLSHAYDRQMGKEQAKPDTFPTNGNELEKRAYAAKHPGWQPGQNPSNTPSTSKEPFAKLNAYLSW
jgi:hypothetical protein